MRDVHLMWQDENTGTGTCPALYQVEGGYMVQGAKVTDHGERGQLVDLADHEDVVFVPANVLDRLRNLP